MHDRIEYLLSDLEIFQKLPWFGTFLDVDFARIIRGLCSNAIMMIDS